MKPSRDLYTPDGGILLSDDDDELFTRVRMPEDLRRAEARLEAVAKYCEERPHPDDPDKIGKERKARAKFDETVAAIDAQYERERSERERKG